jgi:hypothetical protein
MEEDNPPECDLTMIRWSRPQDVGNKAKYHGLDKVVVVAMKAVVAVVQLLQTLAKLTSTPSLEL